MSGVFRLIAEQISEPPLESDGFTSQDGRSSQYYDTPIEDSFFGRGLLPINKACSYIALYREMSSHFPFVILPADATVHSLYCERPFLLLSVLAAASSRERKLQKVLEEELRTTLCTKVVLEGEKSLDLLQGLLVYLAWSADFFSKIASCY